MRVSFVEGSVSRRAGAGAAATGAHVVVAGPPAGYNKRAPVARPACMTLT